MPLDTTYPHSRLLRARQIYGPEGMLPISRSTFYKRVGTGHIPKPAKLGPRISVWRESDIIAFVENGEAQ